MSKCQFLIRLSWYLSSTIGRMSLSWSRPTTWRQIDMLPKQFVIWTYNGLGAVRRVVIICFCYIWRIQLGDNIQWNHKKRDKKCYLSISTNWLINICEIDRYRPEGALWPTGLHHWQQISRLPTVGSNPSNNDKFFYERSWQLATSNLVVILGGPQLFRFKDIFIYYI